MDPQHTFLRVHARLSGVLAQLLTPRIRCSLEYASLGVAIVLLGILTVMHVNFVAQPGCANELTGNNISESQLVQIKITGSGLWSQTFTELSETSAGEQRRSIENFPIPEVDGEGFSFLAAKFWLSWLGSAGRRNKVTSKSFKSDKEALDSQSKSLAASIKSNPIEKRDVAANSQVEHRDIPVPARELSRAAVSHILNKWSRYISEFYKRVNKIIGSSAKLWRIAGWELLMDLPKSLNMLPWRGLDSTLVHWIERRSKVSEPTYLYTVEKGYFWLPEGAKSKHNVKTVNVSISAQNFCFGNRWQQLLINGFIGYDTILMNSLLTSRGQGYLYNFQTKELYDLTYPQEFIGTPFRFEGSHNRVVFAPLRLDYLVSKCGVLLMSLFVFFTTTMSVSFTLRETQSRMLKFTVQLQHHARHHLPTFQLIFVHVIESLVFVPIMIGILFFLFEFYDDQLLAFMVLTLVWLCELFTMISVRTPMSMQYFPRFFLLYFLVFHIYFFSYAYGFSYLAFAATAAFMQHLILYFWNRFEVPALQRFMWQRDQLHQQPGVQITSSTILTSTFHVTRLNARSANQIGGFGVHQARDNQPEEGNGTGSNAVSRSIWTSSDGTRVRSSLHRNFHGGAESSSFHSGDDNHVRRAPTGNTDISDPNYRTTTTRGVNTDSIRTTSSNAMQNSDLRENSTSGGLIQQATGLDLPQTAQTAGSLMNQNSLMSISSLLLWILGGPPDGLVSLPMFRDSRDQRLANSDSPEQENQRNVHSSWWRGSSDLEGLRQRSGHSVET